MSNIKEPTTQEIIDQMRRGVELAKQEHKAAGLPMYGGDEEYPGEIVAIYPDGSRRIVTLDENDKIVGGRELPKLEDW